MSERHELQYFAKTRSVARNRKQQTEVSETKGMKTGMKKKR